MRSQSRKSGFTDSHASSDFSTAYACAMMSSEPRLPPRKCSAKVRPPTNIFYRAATGCQTLRSLVHARMCQLYLEQLSRWRRA